MLLLSLGNTDLTQEKTNQQWHESTERYKYKGEVIRETIKKTQDSWGQLRAQGQTVTVLLLKSLFVNNSPQCLFFSGVHPVRPLTWERSSWPGSGSLCTPLAVYKKTLTESWDGKAPADTARQAPRLKQSGRTLVDEAIGEFVWMSKNWRNLPVLVL